MIEGEHLRPSALAVLPDGRLLFTGTRNKIDPARPWEPHERAIVARLSSNGIPDAGFGDDAAYPGVVVLPELVALTRTYQGEAIVPLADGRLLVAGSIDTFTGSYGFIVRTDAQGNVDGTFGDRGKVLLPAVALHALARELPSARIRAEAQRARHRVGADRAVVARQHVHRALPA